MSTYAYEEMLMLISTLKRNVIRGIDNLIAR